MYPIPFNNPTTYRGHSGVDFPVRRGTLIRASGPGQVTGRAWQSDRAGYSTIVRYDNGPAVLYAHQDDLTKVPAVGTRVVEGTVIGACGNTGNSTGPHVHMEIMTGAGAHTYNGIWKHFTSKRVVSASSAAKTARRVLRRGMVGEDVKSVQLHLKNVYPLYAGSLDVDSDFGPAVEAAVKEFQRRSGLDDDGVVGASTWAALNI